MNDGFWDLCLEANRGLAVFAAFAVFYRLASMVKDRERRRDARALHLIGWFSYIALGLVVTAFGATYYAAGPTPANWTAGARSLLLILALILSAWWPHPKKLTHLGEAS